MVVYEVVFKLYIVCVDSMGCGIICCVIVNLKKSLTSFLDTFLCVIFGSFEFILCLFASAHNG